MEMKKEIIALAIAATAIAGCAKPATPGLNDANQKYFESWIKVNCPNALRTSLGSYILEEKDGSGKSISDLSYITANYNLRSLDGTITSTSSSEIAKQLGTYDITTFYGPGIWYRGDNNLYAGIEELIAGKHVGAKIHAVIPGWLITNKRYDTAEGYLKYESGTDAIYEFEITDAFNNVKTWEVDSLVRYLRRNYPQVNPADTLNAETDSLQTKKYGFYYIRTQESPRPDSTFDSNASVYVNYIGRRLDGTVFDTNIKDSAKFYGLYNTSATYAPTLINWNEKYDGLTMTSSGSEIIDGFKFALFQMKPYEHGTALFYSGWGYGVNGSGESIPSYSPLRFDFELVDKK